MQPDDELNQLRAEVAHLQAQLAQYQQPLSRSDERHIEDTYKKAFGKRLRRERNWRSWSQEKLAAMVGDGTSTHTVGRWENGTNFPTPWCRERLCNILTRGPDELFPEFLEAVEQGVEAQDQSASPPRRQILRREEPKAGFRSVFYFNTTFPHFTEVYGRDRERSKVIDRLSKVSSTSLVGPRRIGKTWLLRCLQHDASELGEHYTIGYIDGASSRYPTLHALVETILHALGISALEEPLYDDPLIKLEMALQPQTNIGLDAEPKSPRKIYVLFIDEFEGIEFDKRLLDSLRSLATAGNLCIVTASRRPLLEIIQHRLQETSPFFNIFEQILLGPFDSEEAKHFAVEKGEQAGFADKDQQNLLKYAQSDQDQQKWYPVKLQLVGQMIQEDQYYNKYRPDNEEYWQQFKAVLNWRLLGLTD